MNASNTRQGRVFLLLRATQGLAHGLLFTALMVFYITVVHMTPFQLVLTGTALEASCLVCQLPTGIVADTFSRRWTVVAGYALMASAYLAVGLGSSFPVIAAAQVVLGVGWSATDGATEAWISSHVADANLAGLFVRGSQVGVAGQLAGLGLMVILGWRSVVLPILAGGALLGVLSVVLAVVVREGGHAGARKLAPAATAVAVTVRDTVGVLRRRPAVAIMLLAGVCVGLSSEGFDRLQTAHLLDDLGLGSWRPLPALVWIAGVDTIGLGISAAGMQLALRWRRSLDDPDRSLALLGWLNFGWAAAVAAFALVPQPLVAISMLEAAGLVRSLSGALYAAWLTRRTDPSVRATVLSLAGQGDALGEIAGGPPVGWIGSAFSIPAALVASGCCLLPSIALVTWARRLTRRVAQPAI